MSVTTLLILVTALCPPPADMGVGSEVAVVPGPASFACHDAAMSSFGANPHRIDIDVDIDIGTVIANPH